MSYIAFLEYFWYLVLLVFDRIGIWSYWYSSLLVFGLICIWSSWKDFQKENISFMLYAALPGRIFEKKDNLQNQECHFLKIACYPILIPDSETT